MPDPLYLASIPTARFVFRISIVERNKDFAVFIHLWDTLSRTKAWVPKDPPRSFATLRGAKSSATQQARKIEAWGYAIVQKPETVKLSH